MLQRLQPCRLPSLQLVHAEVQCMWVSRCGGAAPLVAITPLHLPPAHPHLHALAPPPPPRPPQEFKALEEAAFAVLEAVRRTEGELAAKEGQLNDIRADFESKKKEVGDAAASGMPVCCSAGCLRWWCCPSHSPAMLSARAPPAKARRISMQHEVKVHIGGMLGWCPTPFCPHPPLLLLLYALPGGHHPPGGGGHPGRAGQAEVGAQGGALKGPLLGRQGGGGGKGD